MKKYKANFSRYTMFRKLLLSYLIIIVLPFLIVYFAYHSTTRKIFIEKIYVNTMGSLELVSNGVDDVLKRMISSTLYINEDNNIQKLKDLSENYDGQAVFGKSQMTIEELEALNGIDQLIENVSLNLIGIDNYITIATQSGDLFVNWQSDTRNANEFFDGFLSGKELPSGQGLYWYGLQEDYTNMEGETKEYVITLLKNVYQYNVKYFGTISISIPEKEFGRLLTEGLNDGSHRLIIDEKGKIISSNRPEMVNKNFKSLYSKDFPKGKKGYLIEELLSGQESLISYYRFEYMDWIILDIQTYDALMSDFRNNERFLFISVVFSILIFFFISERIAKSITEPIKSLANRMQNFSRQDSKPLKINSQVNEVEVLNASFEKMKTNIKHLLDDNQKKEQRKREAEMEALQAQISPHFLFNTLNSIRWMALSGDNEQVEKMVYSLGNLLRMTISNKDELISINEELKNVEYYLNIVQLRHDMNIQLFIYVPEEILSLKIPKLLLQPIIENSVIHGFVDFKGESKITIDAYKDEKYIRILVKDNGHGINIMNPSTEKKKKFSSIGLKNIEERIKLYFGEECELILSQQVSGGTVVELKLIIDRGVR